MDKKAAKKLAKENLAKQITKDTLSREGALDQLTLSKLKDKWRTTLTDVKIPEMQENLRHTLHYMEKLIEADTYRKTLFEDERQELQEQTILQAQSHRSGLDKLYDIYQRRIHDLNETFKIAVMNKKVRAEEEFKAIEEREKQTQENLQTMLYLMSQNREKKEDSMNCSMFLKLDDERSKNTEKYENLRLRLEKKMEKRWAEISVTLMNYEEATKLRRKDYIQLKAKDDADSKIIFQQMKKTQKLFEQLDELKASDETSYAPRERLSLIADLSEERAKFFDIFKSMKLKLEYEMKTDKSNLKQLTTLTNVITKDLKRICQQGEQILTLLGVALKLETEWEKVLPVGESLNPIKGITNPVSTPNANEENTDECTAYIPSDFEVLEKFWRKVGRARLSSLTLKKYIKDLEKEHSFLQKTLATYLKKVSENKVTKK